MRRTIRPRVALKLDGSNDSIVMPSYTVPTTAFGVAIWYKPVNRTSNARVADYQAAGPDGGFTLVHSSTNTSQVAFRVNNAGSGTVDILSKNLIMGDWNFLLANFATNSAEYFVNNVSQGTDTSCIMSTPASTAVNIGKRTTGSTNFCKGQFRDFIIMPRKFTASEREELYSGSIPQTVLGDADVYYPLKELSGAIAVDASRNARHGTINGGALYTTEPGRRLIVPAYTKALNFAKKTSSIVTIADHADLRIETNNTFSWFARVHLFDTRENVLIRIAEKAPHFWCIMSDQTVTSTANCVALEIADASDINDTSEYWGNTPIYAHRDYALAVTFNNGVTKHYINGELDVTNLLLPGGSDGYTTGMHSTVDDNLLIGNREAGSRNWPGLIWDFRQASVVWTQDEIRQMVTGDSVSRGLVASLPFSEGSGAAVADISGKDHDGVITAATWQTISNTRLASNSRLAAGTRISV